MIRFRDFIPRQTKSAALFSPAEYESADATLHAMNAFIAEHELDVLSVETVVLPNIHDEDGSTDPSLRTAGEVSATWHQVYRVWYRYHG